MLRCATRRAQSLYVRGMLHRGSLLVVPVCLAAALVGAAAGSFESILGQALLVFIAGATGALVSVMWRMTSGTFTINLPTLGQESGEGELRLMGAVRPALGGGCSASRYSSSRRAHCCRWRPATGAARSCSSPLASLPASASASPKTCSCAAVKASRGPAVTHRAPGCPPDSRHPRARHGVLTHRRLRADERASHLAVDRTDLVPEWARSGKGTQNIVDCPPSAAVRRPPSAPSSTGWPPPSPAPSPWTVRRSSLRRFAGRARRCSMRR